MPKPRSRIPLRVAAVLLAASASAAYAQQTVSKEDYDKLKQEVEELRQEVSDLRKAKPAATASSDEVTALRKEVADLRKTSTQQQQDDQDSRDELLRIVKEVQATANANAAGGTKFLVTGDAAVGFVGQRGTDSTFVAGVSPRFLWLIDKNLEFDAGFDVGLGRDDNGDNQTSFDLTIASVSYTVNDYLTVGGGQFVVPFAAYHRDFDPPWITKLPDDPLVFSDGGLAPSSSLGVFVSGGVPVGSTRVNYAVYGINGPELNTTDGSLGFDNFQDQNNSKAIGGRIGWLPIPELEVGYSIMCGRASPDNFPSTNALLQAVDFNYTRDSDALLGNITFRAEWVFSHVDRADYGTPDAPLTFRNDRNGGYVQASYRPSHLGNKYARNLEFIFRYDRMDVPSEVSALGPGLSGWEQRYTYGIDYWLDPRAVLKVAYECDEKGNAPGADALMVQFGLGF